MEKVKDKGIDTLADLTVAAIMAPVGFAVGNLRSLVDPFALMHEIKFIENKGIQSLADYSVHLFGAVGYGVGIHTLYTLISKSPETPGITFLWLQTLLVQEYKLDFGHMRKEKRRD